MFHERVPRPSQIVKWDGKKFAGSGDPHSHVASYVQVLEAERIDDFMTQYQAFGLTLEGNAADWFQSLPIVRTLTVWRLSPKNLHKSFQREALSIIPSL